MEFASVMCKPAPTLNQSPLFRDNEYSTSRNSNKSMVLAYAVTFVILIKNTINKIRVTSDSSRFI